MSRFASFTPGQWVVFGLSVAAVLGGLYAILFAGRIAAKQEQKLIELGEYDGGSFRPRFGFNDPRTTGMILVGLGAFGIIRQLAS